MKYFTYSRQLTGATIHQQFADYRSVFCTEKISHRDSSCHVLQILQPRKYCWMNGKSYESQNNQTSFSVMKVVCLQTYQRQKRFRSYLTKSSCSIDDNSKKFRIISLKSFKILERKELLCKYWSLLFKYIFPHTIFKYTTEKHAIKQ